jgi:hypothetical protein
MGQHLQSLAQQLLMLAAVVGEEVTKELVHPVALPEEQVAVALVQRITAPRLYLLQQMEQVIPAAVAVAESELEVEMQAPAVVVVQEQSLCDMHSRLQFQLPHQLVEVQLSVKA